MSSTRAILAGLAAGLLILHAPDAGAQRAARNGAVVGLVVTKDGTAPLPYSTISVAALQIEEFTDARGVFRLTGLPTDSVAIRVRHVGYSPVERVLHLAVNPQDTIRIELDKIAIHLNAIQVSADAPCEAPGAPIIADTILATVFDQLKQNADQFRLLNKQYPFISAVERMRSSNVDGGDDLHIDAIDTIVLESTKTWRYAPGKVLTQLPRSQGGRTTMTIPTLANLGDPEFIANHCFHNGGIVSVDNRDFLRLDFSSAVRIHDPDVDGAIYLDPATFQIRRSVLRLNNLTRALPTVVDNETTTVFAEAFPAVPVISVVQSVMHFQPDKKDRSSPTTKREDHALIGLKWTAAKPGDDVKRP